MIIGIQDEILRLHSFGLLKGLLVDKTTKGNIIWGTDAYKEFGSAYQHDKEISVGLITGQYSGIIKNRARKNLEQQSKRTRQHGEVFTPLWICKKMNDFADEVWFGKPDVFSEKKIVFPKGKTWKRYVDSKRLEITCGEAPYLVSRYDISTGESIKIKNRIGILDRKLRVVSENTKTNEEWMLWVIRAFQSAYGYELQGDNLLIARVNMLMTFEEYLADRWQRKPSYKEYKQISNIIAWNIWQMDGLTGTVPYCCKADNKYRQMELFDSSYFLELDKEQRQIPCRIQDWRDQRSKEFLRVNEGRLRK